jgi:hypothetical protein
MNRRNQSAGAARGRGLKTGKVSIVSAGDTVNAGRALVAASDWTEGLHASFGRHTC